VIGNPTPPTRDPRTGTRRGTPFVRLAGLALVALMIAGRCAAASPASSPSAPASTAPGASDSAAPGNASGMPLGVLPPDSMSLAVNNGTTLTVSLVVNGTLVASLEPATCLGCGVDDGVPASLLPPLPWQAEVRSPIGRVLATLSVHEGDVVYTSNGGQGDLALVDLSCGRIELWSGPTHSTPPPGPGTSGDCRP
jgi:hypothetical protein